MALINCPACGKKISSKSKACSHCGFAIGDASEEDIQRKQGLQRYQKLQAVQTQSMIAMLLFISGFGFMYWGGAEPGEPQHSAAIGCSIVGFVWYIVNRVRLVLLKRAE